MLPGTANFKIDYKGPVSQTFLALGITDFEGAAYYIRRLRYGRNTDKSNLISVFTDQCGTCSTKHAVLKLLADENKRENVKLILGIIRMNAENTPAVATTLRAHNLDYIPEAHNYLMIGDRVLDCTKSSFKENGLRSEVLQGIEIQPDQIGEWKVSYHKTYMQQWLIEHPSIPYTLEELFAIREQCIRDLM